MTNKWPEVRLRWVADVVNGGTPTAEIENWGGSHTWVTPEDLSPVNGFSFSASRRTLTDRGLSSSSATLVRPGSLAISTRAPIGYVARGFVAFAVNQGCRAVSVGPEGCTGFFLYVLLARTDELQARGSGSTFLELSGHALGSLRIPLPPLEVQERIADFLDAETAKIDTLIEKDRHLINLLDEKRSALISATVTKGLDPTAPTKPTNIPWLGAIPAHWDVVRLGWRWEVQLGKMLNAEARDGPEQRPYLRNTNVRWDTVDLDDVATMSFDVRERDRYRLEVDDLLVCEGGEVGRAAIWQAPLDECYYQKALHRVRSLKSDAPRFLLYVLMTIALWRVFEVEGNQMSFVHLTAEKLRERAIPLPPLEEQEEIAAYLDHETERIDTLKEKLERQIDLLTEKRQALITAAVTGELEV